MAGHFFGDKDLDGIYYSQPQSMAFLYMFAAETVEEIACVPDTTQVKSLATPQNHWESSGIVRGEDDKGIRDTGLAVAIFHRGQVTACTLALYNLVIVG